MADQDTGAPSIEDRVAAVMSGEPKPMAAEAESPPAPEVEADAPTGDGEVAQPQESPFEFEIVHNGAPVKFTDKAELKDLAEKGFDYTRKAQALAEQRRMVEQQMAAAQQMAQLQPQVLEAAADVKAYERELAKYQKVDWVAQAREDPLAYPALRAAYDQIVEGHKQAVQKAQGIYHQSVSLAQQQGTQRLQAELQKAVSAVPEWRSPEKFNQAREAMKGYLTERGFTQQEFAGINDHRLLLVLRDAQAYNALIKSKTVTQAKVADKSPVATPGASQTKAERQKSGNEEIRRQMKATNDPREKEKLVAKLFAQKIK